MPPEKKVRRVPAREASKSEAVREGDFIEYSITVELQPRPGQKAWVKWGTSSQVREGETAHDAVKRVSSFVEDGLDERIQAQSD